MAFNLNKLLGIQTQILEIDHQSKQCMRMVGGLWILLALCTAYSAFASIKMLLGGVSKGIIVIASVSGMIVVLFSLYILYRGLLCRTLFVVDGAGWRILGMEIAICVICIFCWFPNMLSVFVGDWSSGYPISELIRMNQAGFSFMQLCLGLILTLNIVSEYSLLLACRRHRHIASSVFKI